MRACNFDHGMYYFWQKLVGLHFGLCIFSQTHLVTLLADNKNFSSFQKMIEIRQKIIRLR
jgi:hypothetical protein